MMTRVTASLHFCWAGVENDGITTAAAEEPDDEGDNHTAFAAL